MQLLFDLAKKILGNKVILYLFSRYFTYFIQFLTSIIIAVKLGPYYFGLWGFLLLLINYYHITNFGISNAVNVLLVQNKDNGNKTKNIIATSFLCIGGIAGLILLLALYYWFYGIPFFDKYEVGNLFYVVCVVAVLSHFNVLLMTIYRVKNRLFELAFYQSIIPLLIFVISIILTGEVLLYSLLGVYVLGNLCSFVVFYLRGKIPWGGRPNTYDGKSIINKGFFLFIYNICFYLIITSIKTIISVFYSVEEFGYFSFSYTLANAILLFLQALTFIVFPKIIDKLNSDDNQKVQRLITEIRKSYVTMAFGMAFVAIAVFPLFIHFTPKYREALVSLQLLALTLVLYTNSFGYGTYLMARNKERTVAKVSAISLIVNVGIALVLVCVFNIEFAYVITATIFSYSLYAYLCVYLGKKLLNSKANFISNLKDCFPLELLVPYILAIYVVINGNYFLLPLPFCLFVVLNLSGLKGIMNKIKTVVNRPNVIDLS